MSILGKHAILLQVASHVIADTRCWEGAAATFNFHSVQLMPQRFLRNHNYCNSINNVPIVSNDTMLVFSHIFSGFHNCLTITNPFTFLGVEYPIFNRGWWMFYCCLCLLSDLCALRELLWVALVVQLQSLQSATTEFWKLFRQPGQFPDNLGSFQIILNISRWPGKFPLQNVAKIVCALFYAKFLRGKVWQLESFYFLGLWLTIVLYKVVTQRASVGANNGSLENISPDMEIQI